MKGTKYVIRNGELVRKDLVDRFCVPILQAITEQDMNKLGEIIGSEIMRRKRELEFERLKVPLDLFGLKK